MTTTYLLLQTIPIEINFSEFWQDLVHIFWQGLDTIFFGTIHLLRKHIFTLFDSPTSKPKVNFENEQKLTLPLPPPCNQIRVVVFMCTTVDASFISTKKINHFKICFDICNADEKNYEIWTF